jgi:O-antigen/teichoic acid export membrane protein
MTTISPDIGKMGFLRVLTKGYVFGTLVSAVALTVAIAIIAPGDGGTLVALTSGAGLFFIIAIGAIAMIVFPPAALLSWPFREFGKSKPCLACVICVCVGTAAGALVSQTTGYTVGPEDNWSGALVGFVFSLVWFFTVRAVDSAKGIFMERGTSLG